MNALAILLCLAAGPILLPAGTAARLRDAERHFAEAIKAGAAKDVARVIGLIERGLAAEREAWGGEVRASRLDWLLGLASLRGQAGDHDAAAAIVGEAIRTLTRLHGPAHWRVTDARWRLAEVRRTPEERQKIARLASAPPAEAVRASAALLGERHPAHADALHRLGKAHWEAGEYAQAVVAIRRGLAVRVAALGEDHPDTFRSLHSLAAALQSDGRHEESLAPARRSEAAARAIFGPGSGRHAEALMILSGAHRGLGEHRRALPLLRRALAAHEAEGDRESVALALNNLGTLLHEMGDTPAALSLTRRAVEAVRAAFGERGVEFSTALNNMAGLCREMGDHEESVALSRKVFESRLASPGRRHPLTAQAANNLALALQKAGKPDEALPLFKEALALYKGSAGVRHPEYGACLQNLAGLHLARRSLDEALSTAKEAAALTRVSAGGGHPSHALALNLLGEVLRVRGDHDAALPLYRQALGIQRAALGERHHASANTLGNAAAAWAALGHAREAGRLAERSLALSEAHLRRAADAQPEREQLAAADAFRHHLDVLLSIDRGPAVYRHVLAARGAVLLAQRSRRVFAGLRADTDPEVRTLAAASRSAGRALATLPASRGGEAGALARRKEEIDRRLASLAAGFRQEGQAVTPDAVAAALPEGAALIDYFFYRRRDFKAGSYTHHLAAFVLRRGRPVVRLDLGDASPIERAVNAWVRAASRGLNADGSALRRMVWLPVEAHLGGARSVFIGPDGALAWLPFAALPGAKGGAYLLEEVTFTTLPTARLLFAAPAAPAAPSLFTLGGLDYAPRPWAPLPATAAEASAVAARFRTRFPEGRAATLAGKAGGRDAVCRALEAARFIHLATHGYSFAPAAGRHPLLASGVAVSGEDLTALEVAELDLTRADLAVLSACQTGVGKEASGEGLLGLQRAFQVAGCRSVVASLWSVPDRATAVLMERFYANLWGRGMTRAEALREAQLFVLNHGMRHPEVVRGLTLPSGTTTMKAKDGRTPPFHWAAWVLSGDWR